MITGFVCDGCGEAKWGSPCACSEGDYCTNCWVEHELAYRRTIIKSHEEHIKRIHADIQKELVEMDNLMEQRV